MEATNNIIYVGIVEDDRSLRQGLGLLINATAGYSCPRTFGSVEEALQTLDHSVAAAAAPDVMLPDVMLPDVMLPDVMLLDIHLPGMLGSDGVKVFREK